MKTPQTHPVRPSNAPLLSYHEALNRYLRTEQGGVTTVKACAIPDFLVWLDTCLAAFPEEQKATKQACLQELSGLDYTDHLARWYALEIVLSYRIPIALFTSAEEAA